jgi:hypothetical protein
MSSTLRDVFWVGLGVTCLGSWAWSKSHSHSETLSLHSGYIYRLRCEGRLLVSAVGNEQLLRLDALPRELGCGAVLKPLQSQGRTNLILETSAGTVIRTVEIRSGGSSGDLEIGLSAGGSR